MTDYERLRKAVLWCADVGAGQENAVLAGVRVAGLAEAIRPVTTSRNRLRVWCNGAGVVEGERDG